MAVSGQDWVRSKAEGAHQAYRVQHSLHVPSPRTGGVHSLQEA